jgi:spore coat polysaccharide biosynthesis protein SpsF
MGSSRLPGKVLKELTAGRTVLGYLLERLSNCRQADKILVATTTNPGDDILVEWLEERKYPYYRGSENDCLDRFYRAGKQFDIDATVRITSDCPLVIPAVVDEMITYYVNNRTQIDYLSNRQYTNFPEGLDVEIFSQELVKEAADNAFLQEEREHINYYFLKRDSRYRIRYYNHNLGYDYSCFKLSIDTQSDLDNCKTFFEKKQLPLDFSLHELIKVLTLR